MKFVVQGDIHLRDKSPVARIDDYRTAELDKLQQLVTFANENNAALLLAGDLFDTFKVSAELLNQTIEILSKCSREIVAVLGQHDIPYHQVDEEKSPVQVLVKAGVIDKLLIDETYKIEDITIYGASWEKKPKRITNEGQSILLGHISVFEDVVPFYWKGEGYTPKTLTKEYPGFTYYVCGDIHKPFVKNNVIVSGSMMRQSIDQVDYEPRCYLIDTDSDRIKPLFYRIDKDVFNIVEGSSHTGEEFDNLIAAMSESTRVRESFRRDCMALASDEEPIKTLFMEIFNDFDSRNSTVA